MIGRTIVDIEPLCSHNASDLLLVDICGGGDVASHPYVRVVFRCSKCAARIVYTKYYEEVM
jgi:hypothetical protein